MGPKNNVIMLLHAYLYNDWRVLKEANSLAKHGYNVTILCLRFQDESYENYFQKYGFSVRTILTIDYQKRRSLVGVLLFWISSFRTLLNISNVDIIHSHDLPALVPGILFKMMRRNIYVVFDSHELFADAIYDLYGVLVYSIVQIIENVCIFFSDVYIGVMESQITLIKKRIPRNEHIQFHYIPNYPELVDVMSNPITNKRNQIFTLAFLGSMTEGRCYDELLDAIKLLVARDYNIKLYIIGMGVVFNHISNRVHDENLAEYVTLTGYLTQNEARVVTAHSDVGLILVQERRSTVNIMPNKFYEYLQLGLGVISVYANGIGKYLKFVEAGIIDYPVTQIGIYSAIVELMNNESRRKRMILKGQQMIEKKWNWTTCESELLSAYSKFGE
jgi:glycosyltransferase involved in cell wall biosynthesis